MKYDNQSKNRIKRIEGQLRGILKMMEEDKDCREIVTQLSAVRSAADRTIGLIVSNNLVECVLNGTEVLNNEEIVKEAVSLLVKSR